MYKEFALYNVRKKRKRLVKYYSTDFSLYFDKLIIIIIEVG